MSRCGRAPRPPLRGDARSSVRAIWLTVLLTRVESSGMIARLRRHRPRILGQPAPGRAFRSSLAESIRSLQRFLIHQRERATKAEVRLLEVHGELLEARIGLGAATAEL